MEEALWTFEQGEETWSVSNDTEEVIWMAIWMKRDLVVVWHGVGLYRRRDELWPASNRFWDNGICLVALAVGSENDIVGDFLDLDTVDDLLHLDIPYFESVYPDRRSHCFFFFFFFFHCSYEHGPYQ